MIKGLQKTTTRGERKITKDNKEERMIMGIDDDKGYKIPRRGEI